MILLVRIILMRLDNILGLFRLFYLLIYFPANFHVYSIFNSDDVPVMDLYMIDAVHLSFTRLPMLSVDSSQSSQHPVLLFPPPTSIPLLLPELP